MKTALTIVTAALAAFLLPACQEKPSPYAADLDSRLVKEIEAPEITGAIIAEHTLYPYHFVADSSTLNELGERDMRVLATHFRDKSGDLNVRRAGASKELYNARVAGVLEQLRRYGVAVNRIKVADGLPGGEGMTSERVVKVLHLPSIFSNADALGAGVGGSASSGVSDVTPNPGGEGAK
jgi:hypothetical protein